MPRSSGFFFGAAATAGLRAALRLLDGQAGRGGLFDRVLLWRQGNRRNGRVIGRRGREASVTGGLSDSAVTLAGPAEVETVRESLGAGAGTCAAAGSGALGCTLAVTGGALSCRVTCGLAGAG